MPKIDAGSRPAALDVALVPTAAGDAISAPVDSAPPQPSCSTILLPLTRLVCDRPSWRTTGAALQGGNSVAASLEAAEARSAVPALTRQFGMSHRKALATLGPVLAHRGLEMSSIVETSSCPPFHYPRVCETRLRLSKARCTKIISSPR